MLENNNRLDQPQACINKSQNFMLELLKFNKSFRPEVNYHAFYKIIFSIGSPF